MNSGSITALSLVSILAVTLPATPAIAGKEPVEKYQADAIVVGRAGGFSSSVVHINIYMWSSDEDREEILDAVQEASENRRAYRAVPEALRKIGKAGYMFLEGGQGWPIRYARVIEGDGKREIILAMDRPVTLSEVYRGTAVRDFDITTIVLSFADSTTGEGVVSVGTEVRWNEAEGRIEITNSSSQPVELQDVRAVE